MTAKSHMNLGVFTSISCLMLSPSALGQGSAGIDNDRNLDGIAAVIRTRDALLAEGLAEGHERRKARRTAWMEARRLDVVFTYDSLALGALGRDAGWGGSSGDATMNIRWQINADTSKSPLSLNMRVRHRHAYSDLAPSELKSQTGALWGYVDGFTDAEFQVPEIYLEDKFFDQRLTLRYGQMTIDDLLDGHQLRSAKRSFTNQAFSSSPAVGFPGSDLGFVARWESRAGWDLTFGVSRVDSTNLSESAEWRFNGASLMQALQAGCNFDGWNGRQARAQLMLWRADAMSEAGIRSGQGLSLTLEQQLSDRAHSFFRYAWAEGKASVTSHFSAAGVAFDFDPKSRLGLSVAAGNSSRNTDVWQCVTEVFFRRQIGKSLLVTPDIQFVAGDGIGNHADWLLIGGVRVGISF